MTFPETTMPIHPRTGLAAVGIVGGKPVWPILGGDGTGDGGSATGGDSGQAAAGDAAQNGSQQTNAGGDAGAATGQQNDNGADTGKNGGQQQPKPGPPAKTFSQAELDKFVQKRMTEFESTFVKKLGGMFGADDSDGKNAAKPEDVLKQMQDTLNGVRQQANAATAESLARAANIKPERLDTFIGLAMNDALKDVDPADPAAVKAALKVAVDAKAAEFPEWKTDAGGTATAAASGGDRGQAQGGKKKWTRDEISKLSQDDLVKHADELQKAAAENRIS